MLKNVYPRHKIKVVAPEDDESEHYEVEKILQHRRCKESNQFEYLVKWKDEPTTSNSWVKESNVDTIEIINKFWKSIGNSSGITI